MKIQAGQHRFLNVNWRILMVGAGGIILLIAGCNKGNGEDPIKPLGTPNPTVSARETATPIAPIADGMTDKMEKRFKKRAQ